MSAISNKQSDRSSGESGETSLKASAKRLTRSLVGQGAYDLASEAKRNHKRWLAWPFVHLRILCKWFRDKRQLPLSWEHWQLYAIIHHLSWDELRDFPNLVAPRDFNDRIQWLKLFDQSEEHIRCSDKVAVRGFVEAIVGSEYLTKLYQVCGSLEEIDFEELPDAFVIKTNHDSGSVLLVPEKRSFDELEAHTRISGSLDRVFGWAYGEWAYRFIKPQLLVEEFLPSEGGVSPADYKFHCVDGRIKWLQYIFDRNRGTKEVIVSPDGTVLSYHFDQNMQRAQSFSLPSNWEKLCSIAEALAKGWKYTRVDLYNAGNRILFGEITFYPLRGCYKGEGQRQLGQLLDFDRTTFKPPIYRQLAKTARR